MASTFYITEIKQPRAAGCAYVVTRLPAGERNATHIGQVRAYVNALSLVFRNASAGDTYNVRYLSGSRYSGTVNSQGQQEAVR